MKNASQCADNLASILKDAKTDEPPPAPDNDDPIHMLVYSFLLWETTAKRANTAYESIINNIVDCNDLRMHLPHEIVEMLGSRYPKAEERAERMRATLRDIFVREHDVNLNRLTDQPKRDIRKYLDSLDGMVPFVAARVLLLAFGGHAIPVDDQLRSALIKAGAADESADIEELTSWLERQIKASDAVNGHATLQTWVEQQPASRKSTRKTGGRKTTGKKKPTSSSRKKSTAKRS